MFKNKGKHMSSEDQQALAAAAFFTGAANQLVIDGSSPAVIVAGLMAAIEAMLIVESMSMGGDPAGLAGMPVFSAVQ